eukprot:TRINITY_DN4261_c0_g1_i2.p1 TRINITY_DN4261_c0_g1~~TRINITY_DN4261_c0_g1_i2.p1  ORF type:complete len:430 (+),score=81.20 TRINITY_DN4261_c0_g1_i2:623-1912(+)
MSFITSYLIALKELVSNLNFFNSYQLSKKNSQKEENINMSTKSILSMVALVGMSGMAEGSDFFYYRDSNANSSTTVDGVKMTSWIGDGASSWAFGKPYATKLEIPPGKTWGQQYWNRFDALYVVIKGNASFGDVDTPGWCFTKYDSTGAKSKTGVTSCVPSSSSSDCTFTSNTDIQNSAGGEQIPAFSQEDCCNKCKSDLLCKAAVYLDGSSNTTLSKDVMFNDGDALFVRSGILHGGITNKNAETVLTLFVLTREGWKPVTGTNTPEDNASIISGAALYRTYRQVDSTWYKNPTRHTELCLRNGGMQNMMFPTPPANAPTVIRVRWSGNCSIPYHYHPTGALYFVQYGTMYFKGDYPSYNASIVAGELRWVRPGWDYGPEYNDENPMQITVIGTDTPPTFEKPPPGDYIVQKTTENTQVFPEAVHKQD